MGPRVLLGWSSALGHTKAGHPECAERAVSIERALRKTDLLRTGLVGELQDIPAGVRAEEEIGEVIARVHNVGFLRGMQKLSPQGVMQLDTDTYATSTSYEDLLKSVSVACALVDQVVSSDDGLTGFGLVRPPGHHSIPTRPMGFCIFNTISCAVRHAMHAHGMKRVCIFDFDVHHGNGTQDIFFEDKNVLYISSHQEGSFPGTGKAQETGRGEGVGATMNIPIPSGAGDEAARALFDRLVAPAIRRHDPEIIFVSAGYDAHWKDPQAALQFQSSTFYHLSKNLKELSEEMATCRGRCVFVLEGGYDLNALGDSVVESLRGMCGLESKPLYDSNALYEEPMAKVEKALENAYCAFHS